MSPKTINSLPLELFIKILSTTLPRPVEEDAVHLTLDTLDTIHPRNFLSVCRHWKLVVSTTQTLWTHYALDLDHASESHIQMATRLLRSTLR